MRATGIATAMLAFAAGMQLPAEAQGACRRGETLTINDEVSSSIQFSKFWWIYPRVKHPCIIILAGNGRIPSACRKGQKFKASGRVGGYLAGVDGQTADYVLAVSKISCP